MRLRGLGIDPTVGTEARASKESLSMFDLQCTHSQCLPRVHCRLGRITSKSVEIIVKLISQGKFTKMSFLRY